MPKPKLSIIIPMREGVSKSWLEALLKVQGDVEFILVYPPDVAWLDLADQRLRQISSPLRGELIQRVTALLNATGKYVLSINCDEYLHPNIVETAEDYFKHYPDSYFFRLNQIIYPYGTLPVNQPWEPLEPMQTIKVRNANGENSDSEMEKKYMMREIPIAPLENKIDFWALFRGRQDQNGPHQENFDKKVWKNDLVQATLQEMTPTFNLFGPFKYIPFWTADRFMGLSVQARFYESGKICAHWLPLPEQLRTEDNPPNHPRKNRRYILAEISLLRRFPQFTYLWNLGIFDKGGILMVWFPLDTLRAIAVKLGLKQAKTS